MRRSRALAALLPVLVLGPAAPALAVTDEQLKQGLKDSSGTPGVPHVSFSAGPSLGRAIVGLLVVVGVIFVVARILRANQKRRFGAGRSPSRLVEVLSTTPLGPNRSLHLLRVGHEVLLVGAGEGGITPIRTLDAAQAAQLGVMPPDPDGEAFAAAFARAGGPEAPAPSRSLPASEPTPPRRSVLDALRDLTSR